MLTVDGSEEFLGDFNVTGKDKDAAAMADLTIYMLKSTEERYKPEHEDEIIVDAVVTDNPSVHHAMRPIVNSK